MEIPKDVLTIELDGQVIYISKGTKIETD